MPDIIQKLLQEVGNARSAYLNKIANITEVQAQWKPTPEEWNITEITEHLFWAENNGIIGMWKTLHAIREGSFEKTTESDHQAMSIEKIIDITWQPKEQVPAGAEPRFGGPISFWRISFKNLQEILEAFAEDLKEDELRLQAQKHPISGALDFHQRFEFLRFHINRHEEQVSRLFEKMK
ncbi:MAG TPA: DinB family protein [Chitinophagaceae bacterium]|nr:DinB family protein [Chitinophagales bacterium]HPG10025.1 DinB family protein [Chitinophagaceae bacterium]HRX93866.1 DinB family protein [Chitinophagaceae bacterium]